MEDQKVCNILTKVRGMSVNGQSPVDYIDGVLDTIPSHHNFTPEAAACPRKTPLLGADYGPTDAKPCF